MRQRTEGAALSAPLRPACGAPWVASGEALLRLAAVERMTGLSSSTIYRMMPEGRFPRPRRVGERAVAWLRSELVAWIDSLSPADPDDMKRSRGAR